MANAKTFGDAAGDSAIQRKLLADVGYIVAPIQVQEQTPLNVRQEVMDSPGLAATS
jgi:hypothetical protein